MTNDPHTILLISLQKEKYPWLEVLYADLFSRIRNRAVLHEITTPGFALQYLSNRTIRSSIKAIILTDPEIVKSCPEDPLVLQLAEWTCCEGGTLIHGCLFSSMVSAPDFWKYMRDVWSLPWKYIDYSSTVCTTTKSRPTIFSDETRVYPLRPYSMKAVLLEGVEPKDRVYVCSPHSTAVAFTKVGQGYLGWIGDVNGEDGSTDVVLAMCGL